MKLRGRNLGLLGLLLVAAASCTGNANRSPPPDPRVVALFGGESRYELVATADKVEAFRVASRRDDIENGLDKSGERIDGYRITAGPVTVDANAADVLRKSLLSPEAYYWGRGDDCMFEPGVAIRFISTNARRDVSTVEVIICFKCSDVEFWHDAKVTGYQSFRAHDDLFLTAIKKVFPKDAEIQSLKSVL